MKEPVLPTVSLRDARLVEFDPQDDDHAPDLDDVLGVAMRVAAIEMHGKGRTARRRLPAVREARIIYADAASPDESDTLIALVDCGSALDRRLTELHGSGSTFLVRLT